MAIYSGFSHKKMVISHCYVSSPEGRKTRDFWPSQPSPKTGTARARRLGPAARFGIVPQTVQG